MYAIGLTDEGMTRAGRECASESRDKHGWGSVLSRRVSMKWTTITRTVAHDIRSQYTLAFKPGNRPGKGGYQAIRVEAQGPERTRLIVRTRSGYYPGEAAR